MGIVVLWKESKKIYERMGDMASHFSTIGLNLNDEQEFYKYFELTFENGERIKTKSGTYVFWDIRDGVELWGQLDKRNNAIGLNPHFTGSSKMKVRIMNKVEDNDNTVLDGSYYCWANPMNDEDTEGEYPFVFDLPNMALYDDVKLPQIVTVQLAAFAHEVKVYENEEEYDKLQTEEVKWASKSFVPSGLFSLEVDGGVTEPPQAEAILTGIVLETKTIKNAYTNNQFVYAKVDSLGGEFDVVIDPEILIKEVKVGGIIQGEFWISGKIADENLEKKKKIFLKFGK